MLFICMSNTKLRLSLTSLHTRLASREAPFQNRNMAGILPLRQEQNNQSINPEPDVDRNSAPLSMRSAL